MIELDFEIIMHYSWNYLHCTISIFLAHNWKKSTKLFETDILLNIVGGKKLRNAQTQRFQYPDTRTGDPAFHKFSVK